MEFVFHYFVFVKLLFGTILFITGYKAFQKLMAKDDKKWNGYTILFGVLLLFAIFNPVKLDVNTPKQQQYSNHQIEESKVLPSKVEDNSFQENSKIQGITEEDIN